MRLFVLALLVISSLAGCRGQESPAPPAPAVAMSNYVFTYEHYLEPKILQLRKQENFDRVLQGSQSELEVFERLTLWARRQFQPGFPDPYPLSNGLDVLADIRSGKTKGFCGQYAYLLADALKSVGFYDVRYVELAQDQQHSHFLVEVWSNSLSRWILLDGLYAALVVDAANTPQSAWSVHAALVHKQSSEFHRRWLAPESEVPRGPDAEYFALYARTAVSLRNDLARMDHPWTVRERFRDFLQIGTNLSALPDEYENISNRAEDFLAPRNLCDAHLSREDDGIRVRLSNDGTCVFFDSFEIRLDEGAWKKAPPDFKIKDPFKKFSCRTTNRSGLHGPLTVAELP